MGNSPTSLFKGHHVVVVPPMFHASSTSQGNYSVQIHVKPTAGMTEFMCIQVDFEVVAPSGVLGVL